MSCHTPGPVTARCRVTPPGLPLLSVLSHPQVCGIPPVTLWPVTIQCPATPWACGVPPVTTWAFTTQRHLPSTPGPAWLSQQPWAHHCLVSCHPLACHRWVSLLSPPGCHHPVCPHDSSQPGQDSLGETQWGSSEERGHSSCHHMSSGGLRPPTSSVGNNSGVSLISYISEQTTQQVIRLPFLLRRGHAAVR